MNGHCLFDTALGTCAIAWSSRGVVAFALPDPSPAATVRRIAEATGTEYLDPPREIARVITRVQSHLGGELDDFSDVRLDLSGVAPFSRDVYRATRQVAPGRVVTYSELAKTIEKPRAARAVGRALAKNPIALLVPCHRVVSRSGRLGGFSAPGGIDTKRRLLAIESSRSILSAPEPLGAVA